MVGDEEGMVWIEEVPAAEITEFLHSPSISSDSSTFSRVTSPPFVEWFNGRKNNKSASDGNYYAKLQLLKESKPMIPKVPEMLREKESSKGCYDPVVVSIGPYHHGKPCLQEIEELKAAWADQYLSTIDHGEPFPALYQKVAKVACDASKYYDMDIKDMKEFTNMMFLDGCFILQFVYCVVITPTEMWMKYHQVYGVTRDLMLLENQLPYTVLQELVSMRFSRPDCQGKDMIENFMYIAQNLNIDDLDQEPPSWFDYHCIFNFGSHKPNSDANLDPQASSIPEVEVDVKVNDTSQEQEDDHKLHILQIFREKYVKLQPADDSFHQGGGASKEIEYGKYWLHSFRSAKDLNSVGIKFKANKNGKYSDIAFATRFWLFGELTLPPLMADDSTKSWLLNMVAWESSPAGPDDFMVSSYIAFMDSLLRDVEDVKVLRSHGIVKNFLTNGQDLIDVFADIPKFPHPLAYAKVGIMIEKHFKSKVKLLIAEWLHTHFSSPWTSLAFLGAIFAIALTLIQTYFAVNPRN